MTKTRIEAFSDGVIAIIITIMVLELKVPHETSLHALFHLTPVFLSYILSFILCGIYWGNHHHLLHTVTKVTSSIIWSNLHLLFWLSIIPFATAWMGENNFERITVSFYAVILMMCAVAYTILQRCIMANNPLTPKIKDALNKQAVKGYISLSAYILSIPLSFVHAGISALLFVFVAVIWIIPDKNIERALRD